MGWQRVLFGRHLEKGEHLLFVAHKHWIELVRPAVITAVFGFGIPWLVWFFFPAFFWVAVAWTGVFWLWFLYHFADWYFDAWLATNYSVIDVEWKGIFHHLSSRIPYSEVREISWEVKGVLGTVLRFGRTTIGMATGGQVSLDNMASPKRVELKLIEIRDEFLLQQRISQSDALKDLLSDLVAGHVRESGVRSARL